MAEQETKEVVEVEDAQQNETIMEETKHLFTSKTVWINVVALLAFWLQKKYGFVLDADLQVSLLTGINIWLRSVTKDAVRWKLKKVE
jgi:hypothetical protein